MIPITFDLVASSGPELVLNEYTGANGIYVARIPDDASKYRIIRLCEELGVQTEHDKLHVTVMYSKIAPPVGTEFGGGSTITALCNALEVFVGHNGKKYLIMKLVTDDLIREHARFLQAGAVHSFVPYSPHVTLVSDVDVTADLESKIAVMNRQLALDPIYVVLINRSIADLKED